MFRDSILRSIACLAGLGASLGFSLSVLAATTVPGAPTIGKAVAGNAQASVAFTAPASNGGSAITGYTASCVNVNNVGVTKTGTGSSSPVVVSGLSNGSVYSCNVPAKNGKVSGTA